MDAGSFIVHVKVGVIYNGIVEDVEIRFDTSNFLNFTDHYGKKKLKK